MDKQDDKTAAMKRFEDLATRVAQGKAVLESVCLAHYHGRTSKALKICVSLCSIQQEFVRCNRVRGGARSPFG